MTFNYNGIVYCMWFRHQTHPSKLRYTYCTIVRVDGPREFHELVEEDAYCSDSDNFCRAVGRKLALARALRRLTTDREFRRVAWQAYHNRGLETHLKYVTGSAVMDGDGRIVA